MLCFLFKLKFVLFCCCTSLMFSVLVYRMAKTIIDALLGLNLDDTSSNLAAATLFFVLTSDVSYL